MADGLLHAYVRKRFGEHGFFDGRVTELWARGHYEYAHVVYDDGDCEDLAVADARALVVSSPETEARDEKHGAAAAPAVAVRAGNARKMTDYMNQPVAAATAAKKRSPPDAAPAPPSKRAAAPATAKAPAAKPKAAAPAAQKAKPAAKAKAPALTAEQLAAAAEAKLIAQEQLDLAPVAGDFEVATLKGIGFTVSDTLWKDGASALLAKLGPSPSLKTLLRQKEVPTTRRVSRSELHQKAHQLRECFADSALASSRKKYKSELEALLRKHSKQPPAAASMEADDEPLGAQQQPLKVGSLVALLPDDGGLVDEGSLRQGRLGRVQALYAREEDGELMATVKRVNDGQHPSHGAITAFYAPAVKTEYKASQLRCMDHLEVAALGEPLPEDGYESHDEVTGKAEKSAFARPLWGTDQKSPVPTPHLLARAVWNYVRSQGASHRYAAVQLQNLRACDQDREFVADLRIFLPADQDTDRMNNILPVTVVESGERLGECLVALGRSSVPVVRALDAARSRAVPESAAALLALGTRAQDGSIPQAPAPAGLSVALKPHQRESLAWMLNEEASEGALRHLWLPLQLPVFGKPRPACLWFSPLLSRASTTRPEDWHTCGGWLADSMGLGKTVTAMALILSDRDAAYKYKPPALDAAAAARVAAADAAFTARCTARGLVQSNATLVIAPVSLIGQWESELRDKCAGLKVARWHDSNRERDPVKLAAYDVVLCTYETAGWAYSYEPSRLKARQDAAAAKAAEKAKRAAYGAWRTDLLSDPGAGAAAPEAAPEAQKKRSRGFNAAQPTLEEICWRRLILDESQSVRDSNVAKSQACAAITSQRRWLMSGTPISTKVDDLLGQCAALQLGEFAEKAEFMNEWVPRQHLASRLLLPALMMRHTADMRIGGEQVLTLPPKTERTVLVELNREERAAYDALNATMQLRWRQIAAEGPANVASRILLVMSLLSPLRQLCSGGSFSTADLAVQRHAKDEWGAPPAALGWQSAAAQAGAMCCACKLEPESAVRAPCCAAWACYDCLADAAVRTRKCPACARPLSEGALPEMVADSDANGGNPNSATASARSSVEMDSKLNTLLAALEKQRLADPTAKALVFSSFTASLKWLAVKLQERGFQHATITGKMSLSQRAAALAAFQRAPPTTIFLLSLRSGAVGLNLTAASQVFLLEPCFNPALEEQAIGRVHRLGQTRPCTVTRLVVRDSLEQRIRDCVLARVAGGAAGAAAAEPAAPASDYDRIAELKAPAGVAGGLRDDKAALRFDELSRLFGC